LQLFVNFLHCFILGRAHDVKQWRWFAVAIAFNHKGDIDILEEHELGPPSPVGLHCLRIDDRAQFKITVLPAVDIAREGDQHSDLLTNILRINEIIEPIVRENLDQWYYTLDLELGA
jgi:hypothetical protein